MALEDLAVENGMGALNGLKSIGLSSNTTIATTVTVSGTLLIISGVIIIGLPLAIMAVEFVRKHGKNGADLDKSPHEKGFFSPNSKVLLSMALGATLLISVGTAMLPRTLTIMVIHIIAGYTCLALSFVHIYQYRKVIRSQAKKFWSFLAVSKKTPQLSAKQA
ncbi:MAG: hypothetical protein HQM16_10195 [Deltaproteobacteria bacterium]|nr:hypothetical protein [Deltaproteobacteria bacterium]